MKTYVIPAIANQTSHRRMDVEVHGRTVALTIDEQAAEALFHIGAELREAHVNVAVSQDGLVQEVHTDTLHIPVGPTLVATPVIARLVADSADTLEVRSTFDDQVRQLVIVKSTSSSDLSGFLGDRSQWFTGLPALKIGTVLVSESGELEVASADTV